jgi:ring-1,2-phenylacetyl-CoA epoxidase subunit PaaE
VTAPTVRPLRRRGGFHPLRVAAVEPVCADAAAISFEVPPDLADVYAHHPGQSLTVRREIAGRQERRSYSICAPAGAPPRIGVRELPGGALSGWLVHDLRPGDVLDVAPPTGRFVPRLDVAARHLLVGAGSGITPLLSIAASVLAADCRSTVALVYGNRTAQSIMFVDELADLKDRHPDRFQVVHVLSREAHDTELLTGRLDAVKLRELLPIVGGASGVDEWWLCGPHGMVTGAIALLRSMDVADEHIHRELFWVEPEPPPMLRREDVPASGATVTLQLDGRTSTVTVPGGITILEAAQRVRPDLPFACRSGVCGTCRALVKSGEVRLRRNFALERNELDAGYALTCQAECATDAVSISYDD